MHKAQAQREHVFILQNSRKVYLEIRQAAESQGAIPSDGHLAFLNKENKVYWYAKQNFLRQQMLGTGLST